MAIGARAVLELVLKWLGRNGIREIYVTTGYMGHLIPSVCGGGNQWNMRIHYTWEMKPLVHCHCRAPSSMSRFSLSMATC